MLALVAGVVFLKQPVHNLLCLITVFFLTVMLYLYSGAEFLAFLFLIVYVGAIAILFLFVIMLLHLKQLTTTASKLGKGSILLSVPLVAPVVIGVDTFLSSGVSFFLASTDTVARNTVVAAANAVS